MTPKERAAHIAAVDREIRDCGSQQFIKNHEADRQRHSGVCLRCMKKIPATRLAVMPEAPFDVGCQEIVEKLDPPRRSKAPAHLVTARSYGADRVPIGSRNLFVGNRRTATV
jgi:hypothetical protein